MINPQIFTYVKLLLALLFGAPTPALSPQQTWLAPPISTPAFLEIQVDISELRRMAQAQLAFSTLIMNGLSPKESFDQSLATLSALTPIDQVAARDILTNTERVGLWLYRPNTDIRQIQAILVLDGAFKDNSYERLLNLLDITEVTRSNNYRGLKLHSLKNRYYLEDRYYQRATIFQNGSRVVITTNPILLDQYLAHRMQTAQSSVEVQKTSVAKIKIRSYEELYYSVIMHYKKKEIADLIGQLLNLGSIQDIQIDVTRTGIDASLTLDGEAPITKKWEILTERYSDLLSMMSDHMLSFVMIPLNNLLDIKKYILSTAPEIFTDSLNKIGMELKLTQQDFDIFIASVRSGAFIMPNDREAILFIEMQSAASALHWASSLQNRLGPVQSNQIGDMTLFQARRSGSHSYVKGPFMIFPLDTDHNETSLEHLTALFQRGNQDINADLKRLIPKAQMNFVLNLSEILRRMFNFQSEHVEHILGGLWMTRTDHQATLNAHIHFSDFQILNQFIINYSMKVFMR